MRALLLSYDLLVLEVLDSDLVEELHILGVGAVTSA